MNTDFDLFDPANLEDPYPALARLRDNAPVYQVPDSKFFLVSRWDDVQEALTRPDDFSSNLRWAMVAEADGSVSAVSMDFGGTSPQVLSTADDPVHKAHRTMLMKTLGKRIRSLEEYVDEVVADLWGEVSGDRELEWISTVADRLPIRVIAELIGLPREDADMLRDWVFDSTEILGGVVAPGRFDELVSSMIGLHTYLDTQLQAALLDPGDNLLGVLAQACHAGELEPQDGVVILLQLTGAGGESTSSAIGNVVRVLALDADLQDRVRRDPDLLDRVFDEVLRLESPFRGHYRFAEHDTELAGVAIPAGSAVFLLWSSANRDPRNFDAPDVLDVDRPAIRQHLAFGRGIHFCAGNALARIETRAAVATLLKGTSHFELAGPDAAVWVPSVFVRRHQSLHLAIR